VLNLPDYNGFYLEQFGLLNVATPNKSHYSQEDLALLESVAFQIGSAIKRINHRQHVQLILMKITFD
jgi:GAF domain-containing protein